MIKTFKSVSKEFFIAAMVLIMSLVFALTPGRDSQAREWVFFSGYFWKVKNCMQHPTGPGPNYWSNSARNVQVDRRGNLHLQITKNTGQWFSSEVRLEQSLGYGTYEFTVSFPQRPLNKNVVLGLFNYLTDSKEFDIEITKWGESSPTNVQFTVQPSERSKNIKRIPLDSLSGTKKAFSYTWAMDELIFRYKDCKDEKCDEKVLMEEWKYRGESLSRGDLRTHINLWLLDGNPPSDGNEVEVILEDFKFSPLSS